VTAEEVMSEEVVTAELDAGIFEVLSRMEEAEVRRVPAVDEDGKVVGIVSFDDFVALFAREFGKLGSIAEAESPAYEE
jgi:CBS domain-containing protein